MYDIMLKARSSLALRTVGLPSDEGLLPKDEPRENTGQLSEEQVAVKLAVEEALKDAKRVVRDVEK